MTVSRETVAALSSRHGLPPAVAQRLAELADAHNLPDPALDQLATLLTTLPAEPSPATTVTDPAEAVDRHIADSLSGLAADPLRQATTIADIGAGAGFPGLVLATALPQATIHPIDSTRRKTDLIARLATTAQIPNVHPIAARAEEWAATDGANRYQAITARALAPLPVLAEYAAPLLQPGGHLVAWKGTPDQPEISAGAKAAQILGLTPLDPIPVRPFPAAKARALFLYRKDAPTPSRFPRRAGMAVKRPLGSG